MVMERLEAAKRHPDNQDPIRRFAIDQAERLLRDAKVKDPGPKVNELPSTNPLTPVIEAYQNQPHTPELITQTFQAIWKVRGERVGRNFEVPLCPYTQEKLAKLKEESRQVSYLPAQLATQQSRHILGAMFPEMKSYSVQEGNSVTNDEDPSGWFDYEAAIDAPYLNTEEGELIDRIKKNGRKLLSLNQYIVAGQDSKLFTAKFLDENGAWIRLGSRHDGRMVFARFSGGGRLGVDWRLEPDGHNSRLGGRSSGVKKS